MFHFKKFSIDDSTAAMKIGTDAVLLGAWTPCVNETRILDIGAGSGILSLMMAQRNFGTPVDAVELNPDAAFLALQNVHLSPWFDRINVYNQSFQDFASSTKDKYSLIICNPPFFSKSLKANGEARNMARHNDSLSIDELLRGVSDILTNNGKACFIIPADTIENWNQVASKHSLFPANITQVKSSPVDLPHRILVTFSKTLLSVVEKNEILIYISHTIYTNEYKNLTKDFYLNF